MREGPSDMAYPQVTPGRQVRRPEKINPRKWLQLITATALTPAPRPALGPRPFRSVQWGRTLEAKEQKPPWKPQWAGAQMTAPPPARQPVSSPAQPPPHVPHSAITCYLPWAAAGRPQPEGATASACQGGRPDPQAALPPTAHPEKARAWAMDAPQQPAASRAGRPSLLGGRIINTPNLSPRPEPPARR